MGQVLPSLLHTCLQNCREAERFQSILLLRCSHNRASWPCNNGHRPPQCHDHQHRIKPQAADRSTPEPAWGLEIPSGRAAAHPS